MSDNGVLDEHGMLTEKGSQIVRLALRDPETAREMFRGFRDNISSKIKQCEDTVKGYQKLTVQPIRPDKLKDILFAQSVSVMQGFTGIYRDISGVMDLAEMINVNMLEPKPSETEVKDAIKFYHENKDMMKWLKRDLDDKATVGEQ